MQDATNTLPVGTILDSGVTNYKVISVLGQGGFGITYLVTGELKVGNVTTEARFAIKEHFPSVFATRSGDNIVPNADNTEEYSSSLADFKAEAKKLQKMGDANENIVKVNEIFEANGTAYYVMQYINGKSLTKYVESKKAGKLSFDEAITLLSPIFDAVDYLHKSKINHLDIKPDNIMLHDGINGIVPVLIDFGLSVHFKKNGDKTSPKGVQGVSEGYSPMEQYVGVQEFRPETDIYALAATLLYSLTGATPKGAAELRVAELKPQLVKLMPEQAVEGLCKALAKSSDDRTSSISVFKSDLGINNDDPANRTKVIAVKKNEGDDDRKFPMWLLAAIGAVALIVGCVFLFKDSKSSDQSNEPSQKESVEINEEAEVTDNTVSDNDGEKAVKEESVSEEVKTETTEVNPVTVNPTEKLPNPAVTDNHNPVKTPVNQPSSGTISLGYGTWTGGLSNGKASGQGRVRFSSNYRYPGTSEQIEPGYYLEGTYENGQLVIGRLYDSLGNYISTLMP